MQSPLALGGWSKRHELWQQQSSAFAAFHENQLVCAALVFQQQLIELNTQFSTDTELVSDFYRHLWSQQLFHSVVARTDDSFLLPFALGSKTDEYKVLMRFWCPEATLFGDSVASFWDRSEEWRAAAGAGQPDPRQLSPSTKSWFLEISDQELEESSPGGVPWQNLGFRDRILLVSAPAPEWPKIEA